MLEVIAVETDIRLAALLEVENSTLSPEAATPVMVTANPFFKLKVAPSANVNDPSLMFVVRFFRVNPLLLVNVISNSSGDTVVGLALTILIIGAPLLFAFVLIVTSLGVKKSNPELAELWDSHWDKKLPDNLLNQLIETIDGEEDATRNLSGKVIQKMAELIPSLVGGSADLEPSNKTLINSAESIRPASSDSNSIPDPSFSGRNIHFGIREHVMGGITNGLALFGAWRPFCGTFAVFSDFMRPSVRLAAISKLSSIFVFTHDSYGVGEDGPTHQPVEQLWALRLIPELEVWRPADAMETAAAWNFCLQNTNTLSAKPGALFLTRQKTETLVRDKDFDSSVISKGGYTVSGGSEDYPDLVLVSTGSEGGAVQAAKKALEGHDVSVRHVSIPCLERFQEQPEEYQWTVLPPSSIIVVVEAGVTGPWMQFADDVIGLDRYGASAPIKVLQQQFGFTSEKLYEELVIILQDNGILAVEEE